MAMDKLLPLVRENMKVNYFRIFQKRDMWPLIEPKGDLSRSISQIIKKYMMRAVVMNFTAVRKCANKKVFKDTIFCTCIKGTVYAM